MKVLYVSRIGMNEGDLDKYVESYVGQEFELAEWFASTQIQKYFLIFTFINLLSS